MKSASVEQKQEMNKEIMEVYQKHGVNPLGGCLPFLPQLPIFYAFYSLLAYSIELRGAPFAGWIKDLSEKDPYFIMPILMGITMLVQQKMSSGTGVDPTQEKMMMLIMPVFLTFMFLNLASGLNLYFLFSNIFGILLQKLSEHWIAPQPPIGPTASRSVAMPAGKK
jgi:YidC/Oxa1 family membrane protein insertase